MTIEVRQLLINSTVGEEPAEERRAERGPSAEELERLKEDLLSECKTWFMEKLRDSRER
jgi:hypothetical protein